MINAPMPGKLLIALLSLYDKDSCCLYHGCFCVSGNANDITVINFMIIPLHVMYVTFLQDVQASVVIQTFIPFNMDFIFT
jgi:hypothetical protein